MSSVLLPLVPLYAVAAAAKNLACDRGLIPARRLEKPVVSIGNLSVGGSGKTPLTIRLAQLLRERGIPVDVLSRGYGRASTAVARVGVGGSARDFGDEPLLIARSAGVPVYVGADRFAAGRLAESQDPGVRLHLLDDGFQHRRLARNVDIVVLHRSDFFARLLPAGRLRESFSSLRRAQIIVMREEDRDLQPELRRRGVHQPVWWMTRRLAVPPVRRTVAFCSIARPDEFFSELRIQGFPPQATRAWLDHHRYTPGDLAELLAAHRRHRTEAFITTEKDLARLSPEQQSLLNSAAPLHAASLAVRLRDEDACVDRLLSFLPPLVPAAFLLPPQSP